MLLDGWRLEAYTLMKRYGITQKEVAEEVGYTQAHFCKLMHGQYDPEDANDKVMYAIKRIARRKGLI